MNARILTFSLPLFFIFTFVLNVSAQLHLKLQLIGDLTWGVYVKPVGVSPTENTITGSGQVTVVMPKGYQWSALESESGLWSTNVIVVGPSEAPNAQYISFGLIAAEPSFPIIYKAGTETLLFTFKGDSGCPDFMRLIDCGAPGQSDPFCVPNSAQSNPGNDLSVIQFGGGVSYYNYTDNYAPYAWDCQDSDGDNVPNGMEDTNGNGHYDPDEDASDLNDSCSPVNIETAVLNPVAGYEAICANEAFDTAYFIVNIEGGQKPYKIVINDGAVDTTIVNYESGNMIKVLPQISSTYTLVTVIDSFLCEIHPDSMSGSVEINVEGPLVVTDHPNHVTACSGDPVCFEVGAVNSGSGDLQYQWQHSLDGSTWFPLANSSIFNGIYTPEICIADITGLDSLQYRCRVNTSQCNFVYSQPALLIEEGPITFTDQPDNIFSCSGETLQFCAIATIENGNAGSLQYQWQAASDNVNFSNISDGGIAGFIGSNSTCLVVSNSAGMDEWTFRLGAKTGECNDVYSLPAMISVDGPFTFAEQPVNYYASLGDEAIFTAAILNPADPAEVQTLYQWQIWLPGAPVWTGLTNGDSFNGVNIFTGTNSDTFLITPLNGLEEAKFRVQAWTGTCDTITSEMVMISFDDCPAISQQPESVQACGGDEAVFTVGISNAVVANNNYQWQMQFPNSTAWVDLQANPIDGPLAGHAVGGANSDTLFIAPLNGLNGAQVRALVWSDGCGEVVSNPTGIIVEGPVIFTAQPNDATICAGDPVCFSVEINNGMVVGNPAYQWEFSVNGFVWTDLVNTGGAYHGVTTSELCIDNTLALNNFRYRARVRTPHCDWEYSQSAVLSIEGPINIFSQPKDVFVCNGESHTFRSQSNMPFGANGSLNYQWQLSSDNGISYENIVESQPTGHGGEYFGATSNELNLTLVDGLEGYLFRLNIWTATCSVNSETAALFMEETSICHPDSNFVSLSLKLLPNNTHWGVFLKPMGDFAPLGDNILTQTEITIGASHDFVYKNLTSQAGGIWKPGAVLFDVQDQNSLRYYSFYLVPDNNPLGLASGEIMLFSFTKAANCPDTLFLMKDDVPNGLHPNLVNGVDLAYSPNGLFYLGGYHDDNMSKCNGISNWPNFATMPSVNTLGGGIGFSPFIGDGTWETKQWHHRPIFQISPNPANSHANIHFSDLEEGAAVFIHIVSTQGKILQKQPLGHTNNLRLDLTSLSPGMYFLFLEVDGEIRQQEKLVKW